MPRRLPLTIAIPIVFAGAVAVVRLPGTLAGSQATPVAAGPGVVGAWRLTVSPPQGPPHPGLATFAADGTLVVADVPAQPAPPGAPFAAVFFSAGHGAWEATAEGAAFTFDLLAASEAGALVGTLTLRGTATLSPGGGSLSATYALTFTDPAGQVVATGQGAFEGTRIAVEPPATPAAATPAP